MRFRFAVFIIAFGINVKLLSAQNFSTISVNFKPMFGHSVLQLNDSIYLLNPRDSIQFTTLKFYISGIAFWNNSTTVWIESNSFHLLDATDSNTLKLAFKVPADMIYSEIKFKLGIDSLTNVSGAMGGDLDPTKGMYWTWQSGYVNFKLEGKSNLCQSRKHEFQFHLGGYAHPYNILQSISLLTSNRQNVNIELDLKTFISNVDLANKPSVMSPNKEALILSNQLGKLFIVK
jgi:hypothetical protein